MLEKEASGPAISTLLQAACRKRRGKKYEKENNNSMRLDLNLAKQEKGKMCRLFLPAAVPKIFLVATGSRVDHHCASFVSSWGQAPQRKRQIFLSLFSRSFLYTLRLKIFCGAQSKKKTNCGFGCRLWHAPWQVNQHLGVKTDTMAQMKRVSFSFFSFCLFFFCFVVAWVAVRGRRPPRSTHLM